ncbi:MAG: acyltransferase family protein [Proteobacteria bacterium]|nr:acyltransferase family protein [Pseudomonadota bacterium]
MADQTDNRLDWVDAAKGFCIVMVVLMHSTLGVERATGTLTWLHPVIEWARPFRMPDFFLISGLFLAARIDRPWRQYADTKVLHFAYFYVLWFNIHFALRLLPTLREAGAEEALKHYLMGYVEPFGTLWFIYLLAVYFSVAKLLRPLPKPLVLAAAALMHLLEPETTGYVLLDEFMDRFVFFYAGYAYADWIFAFAGRLKAVPALALVGGLIAWGAFNAVAVATGLSTARGVDLLVSTLGVAGVVAFSVLATNATVALRPWLGRALMFCGKNSIVIYLAFTLFMASTRTLLLKLAPGLDGGLVTLACVATGVVGPLLLDRLFRGTRLGFLFTRPRWARLQSERPRAAMISRALA